MRSMHTTAIMEKILFVKTVFFQEKVVLSRILVVHGENYFGDVTSPLILQKFANETVRIELSRLEEKKADLKSIINYIKAEGYTRK